MGDRYPMPGGEYVRDRHGVIWRVVRDGGMVTTADDTGITSAGISWLRDNHGPLVEVGRGEERVRALCARALVRPAAYGYTAVQTYGQEDAPFAATVSVAEVRTALDGLNEEQP